MDNTFKLKKDYFEGPLELLLDLIERRKLFINDISLSDIADDYISYVETMDNFPVSMTANFILVASTLVLIKSKSLLPNMELREDERGDIEDLETRLKIYKIFRDVSKEVSNIFGKNILYSRAENKIINPVFTPPEDLSVSLLNQTILELLEKLPVKPEAPKAVVKKIISLEEMMDDLAKRIQNNLKMSFKKYASKEEKMNAIVGFLALLELVKRGVIAVKQDQNFSDIEMEHNAPGVPNYN